MANLKDHADITDDDESFSVQDESILISSDEDNPDSTVCLTSDDELPSVEIQAKKFAAIKKLFPANSNNKNDTIDKKKHIVSAPSTSFVSEKPKDPGIFRMIEGVNVNLPVNPYGCQVALMSMLIKSIKGSKNCLLESPTGSGKTLALLCGALGWLSSEKDKASQEKAMQYFSDHPELKQVQGAMEYITSPQKKNPDGTPEKLFSLNAFGEKTIYENPGEKGDGSNAKRLQPMSNDGESEPGLVRIHKKRKLDESNTFVSEQTTPEKNDEMSPKSTPEKIRNLVENLHIRTSMIVNSRIPTIYYGARTHKQLQQVIREFGRTSYCGQAAMTVLSSREHSCVREFDRQLWGTKNDMCRGCIKKVSPRDRDPSLPLTKDQTNCKYYDNRKALDKHRLPPAFDLEDLNNAGLELTACPYYAAREMAQTADIVFCPYNYLIDPSIRSSMRINLQDNIVIIDEAHNIEDICRDSATFTFTRDNIQSALKELEYASQYRYNGEDSSNYMDKIIKILKNWDYWFSNQTSLLENTPVNNNEAVHMWESEHFAKTLQNHNIGYNNYNEFRDSAEVFCNKLRDEPGTLHGVTQATGTLVGSLDTALGYLFRHECKYMDDFKPALVRTVAADSSRWRNSQFKKSIEKDVLELRLLCMNPAVVFEGLKTSRCIILASGTLTPLISLHSELDTEFPLKISPSHVIPPDRVWIGTLVKHPNGNDLECKSKDTNKSDTQDSLGQAILWVCQVTPHGVLVFVPSYALLNKLIERWQCTGVWKQLCDQKHVFQENRNSKDHNDIMEDYYKYVATEKGALLFAVYRGKVSEGMDFKDHQARAVITVGVPYPNTYDMAVKAKMSYNDKYSKDRKLLSGRDWLKVQAYRALNQAVGRCVRHKNDWGAVLLIDGRFQNRAYTEHLSKWVVKFLENNHHSFESLLHSPTSLETFMKSMSIREEEDM